MKKIILILNFLVCVLHINAVSQKTNKLELIQGIWENVMNVETEQSYKIIKGTKSLGISLVKSPNEYDFYLLEIIEGFQNYRYDEVDSININSLNKDGKYFTSIIYMEKTKQTGWIKMEYCIVPEYFECNGENMSINGGHLVEYYKIPKLPNEALKKLYYRGKKDKRDYIKEYLDIKVVEVNLPLGIICVAPGKAIVKQLTKGEVVTILEEQENWLKVDYGADNPGWIRKEDVKMN